MDLGQKCCRPCLNYAFILVFSSKNLLMLWLELGFVLRLGLGFMFGLGLGLDYKDIVQTAALYVHYRVFQAYVKPIYSVNECF